MKFVIYDDETLQPITFVNVPGLDETDLQRMGYRISLAPPPGIASFASEPRRVRDHKLIELHFERIQRRNKAGELVEGVMCFTDAAELAVLLKPSWMSGQRSAVEYLGEQNDRLTAMLMRMMTNAGN